MEGGRALLNHARRLIERGWTQHADARAADDSPVHPWDDRASSWSLLGALVAAVEETAAAQGEQAAISELAHSCVLLADTIDADSLEQWNDSPERTSSDVCAALERAGTRNRRRDPFGFSQN